MNRPQHRRSSSFPQLIPALAFCLFATGALADAPGNPLKIPDFTKGDAIPAGARPDWNLGATGARGWMYGDQMVTTDARQIAITRVHQGSPSDGILVVGDVVLGVNGKLFSHDPRTEFGKALTTAETEAGEGRLPLLRWRDGKTEEVIVKLPVLGSYSGTAPYGCPKSERILKQGCEALAKRLAESSYRPNPITRSLNALALLASGDPKYLPVVRGEALWAADYSADIMQGWYYSYVIMLMAEYSMASGDDSVMPSLQRLALEVANGQSIVGSWGHRFARPDGRLPGYGMMNATGLPLTISLVVAREAGVRDPALDRAIGRSARLLRFYTGKGAIPYGDHVPWIESHEDNGKCGMAAVLFNLLDEPEGAEFFSRMAVASHGSERDTGHSGNFFNILWAVPGVSLSGPEASGAWMEEFGGWYFDFARHWDGTFLHQGPPTGIDCYKGWDATGLHLLAYAVPLKKTYLTGRRLSIAPQLDGEDARELILDGRGWSYKDRTSAYDQLGGDQIFECLGSWSPVIRERAAMALGRRKEAPPVSALVAMLGSPRLESRYGACQALAILKGGGAAAVPALRKTLQDGDLWLRIKAAEALAAIGQPAMPALPELLELLAHVDRERDPRSMQQRYFSFALFDSRSGMLGRSLDGVNRELLYKAVRAGLCNEDGRARGSIGSVYRNLTFEDIKPLLPAILDAVAESAPSGEMFADVIRLEGLKVLATHHVEDGIKACVDYTRNQNPWSSENRTPELMKILLSYGAAADSVIPDLERLADSYEKGEVDFPRVHSQKKAASVREAIATIKASQERPELFRID